MSAGALLATAMFSCIVLYTHRCTRHNYPILSMRYSVIRATYTVSQKQYNIDHNFVKYRLIFKILLEFRLVFWHQKTKVAGLPYGVVCVILCLAMLVQCRLVTDRQTDEHITIAHTPLAP